MFFACVQVGPLDDKVLDQIFNQQDYLNLSFMQIYVASCILHVMFADRKRDGFKAKRRELEQRNMNNTIDVALQILFTLLG